MGLFKKTAAEWYHKAERVSSDPSWSSALARATDRDVDNLRQGLPANERANVLAKFRSEVLRYLEKALKADPSFKAAAEAKKRLLGGENPFANARPPRG
jgi:hypothetical protein